MLTDLNGKVVLITGASGGIGQATARAFADEGSRLALHYHTGDEAASRLRDSIDTETVIVGADLTSESDVDAMFARVLDHFGRVDAIVVNAGTWAKDHTPVHEMSLAQWRAIIEADLTSAFLTCRTFLRHLKEAPREPASIVMVGSTAAMFGESGNAEYAAAKAGMVYGLTLSLKNEIIRLAPRGRVNAVCPGWVDTPAARATMGDDQSMDRILSTIALKKIATAEDCGHAIVFLSSDRLAGHLSGAILPVAGGMEGRVLHEE
ncbi:MAG: SDR family NAD(P)-dependent oxidoreductase [Planctomycetota bacterium]|nr:SDR family NAD(P)-dependent oxidoreductase [Planctomycetota bacterium]